MEIKIAMCAWLISVITFFSTIYYLFFIKWTKSKDHTKEKHN